MNTAKDSKWTLWVFAGPGAFEQEAPGQVLPLAAVVGELPAGVALLAETVGAPTLLQQLTGEWPTKRGPLHGLTLGDGGAERDLGSFVAWADAQTPAGSRRALIVLGDLLQAIGEAPKDLVLGDYRPPFPKQITIRKSGQGQGTTYLQDKGDLAQYVLGTDKETLTKLVSDLSKDDGIAFGDQQFYTVAGNYPRRYKKDGDDNTVYEIKIDSSKPGNTSAITITIDPSRSIDDVGRADIDTSTRRIDALAKALDGLELDMIVSDDGDLSRLTALRRLAPRARVLMGARRPSAGSGQPLVVLLDALRGQADLAPEQLAARAVEKAGQSAGLVALRGSGAKPLLDALDDFARQALAGTDSPAMRAFEVARDPGSDGDLRRLIEQIETRDGDLAAKLASCVAATVVAPPSSGGGSSCGIRLDGPGLQLGPSSDWTRLLDRVSAPRDADTVRSTLADLQALTTIGPRARPLAPTQAGCVLEYSCPPNVDPVVHFDDFAKRTLEPCDGRHNVLVIRGRWAEERPGSVVFDPFRSLPIAELARCLRDALGRRGRGPLALILFEDPELLRIETAHELRDLAHGLMTPVPGAQLPGWLAQEASAVLGDCERRAADSLSTQPARRLASPLREWRHRVATRLAQKLAVDPDEPGRAVLQGIALCRIESLCRLFDRLCQRTFDALDDELVLAATRAADRQSSLVEWMTEMSLQFFSRPSERWSSVAKEICWAWGDLGTWVTDQGDERIWLAPGFQEGSDKIVYASRLRMTVGPRQPSDYHALSFHREVRLHALLTAARLLGSGEARRQWGLISTGLAHGSEPDLREQLGREPVGDPDAARYFWALGAPPLLRLAIDQVGEGYELRMESSESQATVVRHKSVIDREIVTHTLSRLGYVMSSAMATREGRQYLEGLGASLSEDVIKPVLDSLELERIDLQAGRHRDCHLALQLPRELMRYPWELMQLRAPRGGYEMLAERYAVGRQMWTSRRVQRVRPDGAIRMLLIADPNTSLGVELPGAREEGEQIRQLCEQMTSDARQVWKKSAADRAFEFVCHAYIGQSMTRTVLRQLLRSGAYDVVHFAGHGTFNGDHPERSGWALGDGLLTARELSNTVASCEAPPALIYANACSVGMFSDANPSHFDGDVHGMADACIRAGVAAYIAPMWKIHDDSARMLATEFYRQLLFQQATIGTSLQRARVHVRKAWELRVGASELGDISWGGMLLFGNPCARLSERAATTSRIPLAMLRATAG